MSKQIVKACMFPIPTKETRENLWDSVDITKKTLKIYAVHPFHERLHHVIMSESEKMRELTASDIDLDEEYTFGHLRKTPNGNYEFTKESTSMQIYWKGTSAAQLAQLEFVVIFPKPYIAYVDGKKEKMFCQVNKVPFKTTVDGAVVTGFIMSDTLHEASFKDFETFIVV
jgi:hypothetical protein